MKLENLYNDEERIDFLLHAIHYTTGCEVCLKSSFFGGPCDERHGLMSDSGALCPDVDFNDVRPVQHA